ncbi:hypothetical protein EH223_11285 [candidate division KSB1 bacterium]|nr:MAG: hypothetical protein EH223_11285 [candidate division KSB1 bacterium]
MEEITLEKTHALLEKLAEYVMNEMVTRKEMNERFEQVDKRFEQVDHQLADIRGELGLVRAEQRVFTQSFDLHHKRLERLEESSFGYNRVRDAEDKGRSKV